MYQPSQYYHQSVHTYPYAHNVQDVRYQRAEGPVAQQSTGQAVLGFPSNDNVDFLQPYSMTGTPVPQAYEFDIGHVDPRLAYAGAGEMDPYGASPYEDPTQFHFTHGAGIDPQPQPYPQIHHPGEVMLTDENHAWNDAGSDFDRFL